MYTLLKIISWKFQILPRKIALFFGRMLGSFFYYFIHLRKSIAMKNLEIAFPDWNSDKRKSLLHSSYRHYGMVLVDFFRLPKVKRKQDKTIVNIPTESIELFKRSSGGIILSGHIGNWEYIGPSLGIHNIKCAGVAQIQRNSTSNQYFNELRRSENVKIIPVDSGSKVMIQTILDGLNHHFTSAINRYDFYIFRSAQFIKILIGSTISLYSCYPGTFNIIYS